MISGPFAKRPRLRPVPLVIQTELAECSLACLAMIAHAFGMQTDLPALRRRFSTSLKGASILRVIEIAGNLGLEARPLKSDLQYLKKAKLPCILHWNMNHFVVLHKVGRNRLEIHDPSRGAYSLSFDEASKHYTGVLLEFTKNGQFDAPAKSARIPLSRLTGRLEGLKRIGLQVFGLAVAVELLNLALPFQAQIVIDQVLPTNDTKLLSLISLFFLLLLAVSTGLSLARGWIVSWLGASWSTQWTVNLFSHLLRLPIDFFEKRHMGDIMSRFGSVRSVQATITGNFIEAILSGIVGLLSLVILSVYSVKLTAFVCAMLLIYTVIRLMLYRHLRRINQEQLVYTARQQSELMESVRGAQAIKLAGIQAERRARFSQISQEAGERDMQTQRIGLLFTTASQGIFGFQRIMLVAFCALLALKGAFSTGMLLAYLIYADQFTSKTSAFVDRIIGFRLLSLHVDRIADLALADPEKDVEGTYVGPEPSPRIDLVNVSFRYSDSDPWIIRNLNLTIEARESVAIVGPSGCGKTTLAKLIAGLLSPTEGAVLVGGIDIRRLGLDRYRGMISAVMQDDQLFAGSIAENISLFDPGASLQAIENAARLAEIHDDIIGMTMGYESLVGDMGSSLSGGQKQRVMLARALYREPRILVMDEATSHLDTRREHAFSLNVRQLDCTRIAIAHRRETIEMCDRKISLNGDEAPAIEARKIDSLMPELQSI